MFKDLKIMKTNIITINTIMKTYMKYFCAVLLVIGTSAHAWGAFTALTLPHSWEATDGQAAYTPELGCTKSGLGSDYATSGAYLRFDNTGDYMTIQLASAPGTLSYNIQGNSFSSGTFKVQESADGDSYTDVAVYTSLTGSVTPHEDNLSPHTRYIKFIFTNKSTGNVGLGTISITTAPTYDVEWHVGESITKSETDVASSTPPSVLDGALGGDCSGLEFVGWTGTEIGSTPSTAPSDLFTGEVTLNSDADYYAVFAEQLTPASVTPVFADNLNISGTGSVSSREHWSSFSNCNAGQGSLRLSTSNNSGVATTEALSSLTSAATTISFKIQAWDDDESGIVTLSASSGTLSTTQFTAPYETYTVWTEVSTTITGGSSSTTLTFTGTGGFRIKIKDLSIDCNTPATYDEESYITVCATCEDRTVTFAASTPSVAISTNTYQQVASLSAGAGDVTYTLNQTSGTGWTINTTDGTVSFNGHVGEGTITATVEEDAVNGYCEASGSYTLTVTPVVPTVGGFTEEHTDNTMTLNGSEVTNKGGDVAITAYGYIYSSVANTVGTLILGGANVTTAQVAAADIALNTSFAEKTINSLSSNTTYYVRAYATNAAGTGYSDIQTVKTVTYSDYQFSCAELSLTPHLVTASTPIFITSAANKKVRSQDYITISGNGLTPNTALTFPGLDSKFEVLTSTGGTISTDVNGAIDVNAYIFYTPAADAETDGLDQIAGLTVSVSGAKPKQASLVQSIIGRHLPTAGYVIAGKKDNKWYALPSNMASTGTPAPSEIAVDNINNPSIAYTAATNIYGLEGPVASNISGGNGQYVRLTMSIESSEGSGKPAPLFGTSGSEDASNSPKVGRSGTAIATNPLSEGWWWSLTQTNTSITNPQDAKYTIKCANNNHTLSIKNSPFVWGLYASGVEELRLIEASNIVPTEAYFVEWAQHGGVVEVDAEGIDATSVIAHLGEATSSAITLVQTKAGDAKNKNSKYNYTVNFGVGIDFADPESNGAMLTLEWKNGETVKAMSNIIVPKIVASNITINKTNYPLKSDWNTEVHILPGKTITVDADYSPNPDVTIKELNIYPGATVVASTGTLIATNLVMRNGWSRAGVKTYDVARLFVTPSTATLKATNVYADWYIDYDQYYPVAVPWNATVENFTYRYCSVSPTVGPEANIRLRYYDGNSRAINVQQGVGESVNWKAYGEGGNLPVPATLTPSSGYVMTAKRPSGKAFSIIRMPLTLPSGTWADGSWTTSGEAGNVSTTHKDQIAVTAHNTGSTPGYAQGWNLIANPYMAPYQGTITYTEGAELVNYVNIPDVDFKEYNQLPTATTKLAPASAFLIQAPKTGTITFGTAKRVAAAPSFRKEEPESIPEQQAYIVLNNETSEDMMGILVSDKYTAEYELNADLEKLLSGGTSLRTYMRYGDMNMAYVAINEVLAKEWIPVDVRLPQAGEYTFSLHEASIAGELEGVYLIDYTNGDQVTNLIEDSYIFAAEAGTISGRFAINAIVGEHKTPTGIDAVQAGADMNSDKPFKFVYRDKVYILHQGVIYDSTGKKVREINK